MIGFPSTLLMAHAAMSQQNRCENATSYVVIAREFKNSISLLESRHGLKKTDQWCGNSVAQILQNPFFAETSIIFCGNSHFRFQRAEFPQNRSYTALPSHKGFGWPALALRISYDTSLRSSSTAASLLGGSPSRNKCGHFHMQIVPPKQSRTAYPAPACLRSPRRGCGMIARSLTTAHKMIHAGGHQPTRRHSQH